MNKGSVKYFKDRVGIEYIITSNSNILYPMHNHVSVYSILFLLEGKIKIKGMNKCFVLEKGMYHVIRPYEVHSIIPENDRYSMICICLNKEKLQYLEYDYIKNIVIDDLKKIMDKGFITFKNINIFLNVIKVIFDENNHRQIEGRITNIIDKIVSSPEEKYDIEYISKEVNISKYYLIRLIKNEIGLTPHKFIIQNRIRKSQKYLNENYNIMEAALSCGFYDESHFIRHFKNILGLTPNEYIDSFHFLR